MVIDIEDEFRIAVSPKTLVGREVESDIVSSDDLIAVDPMHPVPAVNGMEIEPGDVLLILSHKAMSFGTDDDTYLLFPFDAVHAAIRVNPD